MSGKRTFSLLDLALILVVGAGLVVAAMQSEALVPEPGVEAVDIPEPPIEVRDQLYGLAVPEPGVLWVAGNYGKIVRSDDGGRSWGIQPTHTEANLQDLAAWNTDQAVAVGNGGVVLVTSDGGASWEEREAPQSEIVNKLFRVETREGGLAWAVGAGGMIVHSGDYGASWQRRSEVEDVAWNGIAFVDDDTGWAVGEFGRIQHTTDGGLSWEAQESPVERSLMAVAFRDPERGVAVGLDGLILRTDDGGSSWTVMESEAAVHLYDVLWDGDRWLVAGDGGTVLTGDPEAREWAVHPLGGHELGWHTEAFPLPEAVLLVGASQGTWRDGTWQRFTG